MDKLLGLKTSRLSTFRKFVLVLLLFRGNIIDALEDRKICPDGQFNILGDKCEECAVCKDFPDLSNCDECADLKEICPIGEFNLIGNKCEYCHPLCYHESTWLNGCEMCDIEPPTFGTKLPDIELEIHWPLAHETAGWRMPQVTDNSGEVTLNWTATCTVSCTENSCHAYDLPPGVYTVTYDATDPSGNVNISTFKITVDDKSWEGKLVIGLVTIIILALIIGIVKLGLMYKANTKALPTEPGHEPLHYPTEETAPRPPIQETGELIAVKISNV